MRSGIGFPVIAISRAEIDAGPEEDVELRAAEERQRVQDGILRRHAAIDDAAPHATSRLGENGALGSDRCRWCR